MRKLLPLGLLCFLFSTNTHSQDTLFTEDFNTGGTKFTLNTTGASAVGNGYNSWIVNTNFFGGNGTYKECVAPFQTFPYAVPNTPFQFFNNPASPTSGYLHVVSDSFAADGILNSSYSQAENPCFPAEGIFAQMNTDINTASYNGVTLKFHWVCGGDTSSLKAAYGEVYYSTNGGTTWNVQSTPIAKYNGQYAWIQTTITNAAWNGQPTLRFGFKFVNGITGLSTMPAFSLDSVLVVAVLAGSITTNSVTGGPQYCRGDSLQVTFTANGVFTPGNIFSAELSDASGSFAAPTGIGTLAGIVSGTIQAGIPIAQAPGGGYRIRVVSSTPAITGTDNGSDLTIYQNPTGGTVTAAKDTICIGDSTTITLTGYSGSITWQESPTGVSWTNKTFPGATPSSFSTGPLVTERYYRASVLFGTCGPAFSNIKKVSVADSTIVGVATAVPDSVCYGTLSTISVTGFTGDLRWQNSTNDTTYYNMPGGSFQSFSSGILNQDTWFRCIVQSGDCPPDTTNTVKLTIVPQPAANFSWSMVGSTIMLTDLSTGGPTNWKWNFGDTSGTSTVQNPTYHYTTNGNFNVRLITCLGGCCDTSIQNIGFITAMENEIGAENISVFPNPFEETLNIEMDVLERGRLRIELYDLVGIRAARLEETTVGQGNFKKEWNVPQSISAGVYFLRINLAGREMVRKVVLLD